MGGSLGRREATGRGVMIAARESAKHVGFNIKGATVAVQGFGNVGSISAELLASAVGATIVAVTDWKGGIFNAKGLDIPKLLDHVKQHKTVDGFPGAEPLSNADLFTLDVDILIPAALENQITIDNAPVDQGQGDHRRRQRSDRRRTRTSTCTSTASSWCPTSSPTAPA